MTSLPCQKVEQDSATFSTVKDIPKRQFGALKGKIDLGPEFFEPLPEDELKAWE